MAAALPTPHIHLHARNPPAPITPILYGNILKLLILNTGARKRWCLHNNLSAADDGYLKLSSGAGISGHISTYTGRIKEEAAGQESEESRGEEPRIFVGNLAWACTSDDLSEHFRGAGTVEMVEVIYDRETGRSRGFAFVLMSSMEEANTAIAKYDGVEFMGRRLRVSFTDQSRNEEGTIFTSSSTSLNSSSSNANKLFVGNLPWGMDDIALESIFSEHGKVLEARIVYDRDSGRSRGFGFVTLSSPDEVTEAIAKMDGAVSERNPLCLHSKECPRETAQSKLGIGSAIFF